MLRGVHGELLRVYLDGHADRGDGADEEVLMKSRWQSTWPFFMTSFDLKVIVLKLNTGSSDEVSMC